LSVPSGLPEGLAELRPDVFRCFGGWAQLPGGEDLQLPGFPLPAGVAYGCMAEAMLLGWEGRFEGPWTGTVTLGRLERMQRLAERHGMVLAENRSLASQPAPAWTEEDRHG
jgi:predicted amino acid dehydrogenase